MPWRSDRDDWNDPELICCFFHLGQHRQHQEEGRDHADRQSKLVVFHHGVFQGRYRCVCDQSVNSLELRRFVDKPQHAAVARHVQTLDLDHIFAAICRLLDVSLGCFAFSQTANC